jgi:serine/threonine protein kinase, bacterial
MRHRAAESAEGAASDSGAASSVQLTRYITDSSGKLAPAGRTAVEGALDKLSTRHNVHLWVVYVDDFAGLTAAKWAENTMRANGFTDTDGLLAIDTTNRTFAFRPPAILHANAEAIRKERIAPAVHLREWARAAVAAANGLEAVG